MSCKFWKASLMTLFVECVNCLLLYLVFIGCWLSFLIDHILHTSKKKEIS